jgi:5-formyltetrahydrofolate cyclo-ligase
VAVVSINEQKQQLRKQAGRTRAEFAGKSTPQTASQFHNNLTDLLGQLPSWTVISWYLPIGDEIDPSVVIEQQISNGKTSVLPVVIGPDQPLVFRKWAPGQELEKGSLNTRHPVAAAPEIAPNVLLVPLLAFDRSGYRLGWGGGFYDRTLAGYTESGRQVTTIGIAYAGQELDHVPHDAYDQRVDYIVTDSEIIATKKN